MKKLILTSIVLLLWGVFNTQQVQAVPSAVSEEIDAVANVATGDGDGFAGFDDTSAFSLTANTGTGVSLGVPSLSLLSGFGELNAWLETDTTTPTGILSHRGARGLGVWGGEQSDEIDNDTGNASGGRDEYIQILFDEPVYISSLDVRSLFDLGEEDDDSEQAEVYLGLNDVQVSINTVLGLQIEMENQSNPGLVTLTYNTLQLADEVILRIPAGNSSECAFARLVFYRDQSVDVDIEKLVNDLDADTQAEGPTVPVGSTVTFKFVVTNTGEAGLTDLSVDDDVYGHIGNIASLASGASATLTITDTAEAGWNTDIATVTTYEGVTDSDPAYYYGAEEQTGDEGCTPGFWKNNADKKNHSAWVGYIPTASFKTVFGLSSFTIRGNGSSIISNPTLIQSLGANGSGINLLARSAVAALLNASNSNIDYPLTEAQVIAMVQAAILAGDSAIQTQGEEFDEYNNYGCPINQDGERIMD